MGHVHFLLDEMGLDEIGLDEMGWHRWTKTGEYVFWKHLTYSIDEKYMYMIVCGLFWMCCSMVSVYMPVWFRGQDDQSDSSPTPDHYREVRYFHLGTLAARAQVKLQVNWILFRHIPPILEVHGTLVQQNRKLVTKEVMHVWKLSVWDLAFWCTVIKDAYTCIVRLW